VGNYDFQMISIAENSKRIPKDHVLEGKIN
jgi:hypothetical protein